MGEEVGFNCERPQRELTLTAVKGCNPVGIQAGEAHNLMN